MKWAEEPAQWLVENKESGGCRFFKLGASKSKTGEMHIVMGWSGGFVEDCTQTPMLMVNTEFAPNSRAMEVRCKATIGLVGKCHTMRTRVTLTTPTRSTAGQMMSCGR